MKEQLKRKELQMSMVILCAEGATKCVEREKEQDIRHMNIEKKCANNFLASEFVQVKLCCFSSYELNIT